MSEYSKSVIYRLDCNDKTVLEFYICSTYDKNKRKKDHKSNCNNENCEPYDYKVYKFIRENGGWDTWTFEVIQEFPCDNEEQLRIQEQYYYDLLKPTLNTNRPYVSEEEMKKYKAKYYQDNREEFAKYYQDNREDIFKRRAIYREKNREELLKKNKIKHNCECGVIFVLVSKSRHIKTKKHQNFINQKVSK